MNRRNIFAFLATGSLAVPTIGGTAKAAGEKAHRLALHVDQGDIAHMRTALGNASNVVEYFKSRASPSKSK